MNCWGFSGMMMSELKARFAAFLDKNTDNMLKCEYFLPFVVDDLLKEGKISVKVIDTTEIRFFCLFFHNLLSLLIIRVN